MSAIRNIVFDLGGVLIDWNPRYLYRKIFSSSVEMEKFLTGVCNQDWNEKQDEGRSFSEGVAELVLKFPQFKQEIESYDLRWEEMLNGPIFPVVRILESISSRKSYRLLGLSNWSKEKFHIAEREFPFLSLFEDIVVSGKLGLKKPDPRIFEHLCKKHSILPQQTVFIDDSRVNIESALELGFCAIHFRSSDQLNEELTQLGLLK